MDPLEELPMMTHVRILGVAAALALGIWWLAGAGGAADNKAPAWKPILDDADAVQLVKRSADQIQEDLKKVPANAAAKRKANKRIQVAAVEIAALAQSAKPGASRQLLAHLRDAALKLAKEAGGKNPQPAAMKKLADALASPAANAKANPAPVSLKEFLDDQGDVMLPFKKVSLGGDGLAKELQTSQPLRTTQNGIEEKIRALARRQLTAPQLKAQAKEIALMADKIAALAQANLEWVPEKPEGKRDPKDWVQWSNDMRDEALQLAAAARQGNPNMVFKGVQKLNSTCNRCHGVFKPE
jgi:hypothetical protein